MSDQEQKSQSIISHATKLTAAVRCIGTFSSYSVTVLPEFEPESFADKLAQRIQAAEKYIPEPQLEQYQEEIKPKLEAEGKKHLTLEEILALISILLNIYMAILQSLPNKQFDRLAAQNETIIVQQSEIMDKLDHLSDIEGKRLELDRERSDEAFEVTKDLIDALDILSEQVQSLAEQGDDLSDIPDSSEEDEISPGQDSTEDSQSQNKDTQN